VDYAKIRAADGHADVIARNFRNLPYVDRRERHADIWTIRRRSYEMLVGRVLPKQHCKVLDLGAGSGWLSARLSALGHALLAFDVIGTSEPWLVVQADFDQLPIASASADIAIFNGSFHYSRDYLVTLREALRVLKPSGAVVIMDTPIYHSRASGETMAAEMRASLRAQGVEPIDCRQFLTWHDLGEIGKVLNLRWRAHRQYGARAALKPWIAKLRGHREPASFAVLVGRQT